MSETITIDERMDAWLNEQADMAEIHDNERQRFIEHMRETTAAAVTRLRFTGEDLIEDSRIMQLLGWLVRKLHRDEDTV